MTDGSPGPVAVVTGAARGIGAATARRLAKDGWRLVLIDRCADDQALAYPLATTTELDGVAAACGGAQMVVPVIADVRDGPAVGAAVHIAIERWGRLDAAIACAGAVAGGMPGWEITDDLWAAMIGINLQGTWQLARAAIPALLDQPIPRHGRVVAVASAGAVLGLPRLAAYTAAKAGVVGLVRSLAAELAPHGITANVVSPGSTDTAILQASAAVYDLAEVEEFAAHHLLPRLLTPDEPAALIAWLCGPDSSGITGAVLPVDAGMTAH